MNTVQRISRNIASLFAAEAVVAVLGLALSILIARTLGDAEFGNYSFALAFTAIFGIFLDLGFNRLIVREVARDKAAAAKYLGNIAVVKAALSVVVFASMALIVNLMSYPRDVTIAVLVFGLYIIFIAFGDLFRATFRAFERMEYEALVSIMRQGTITLLGVAAVLSGYGLIHIAYAFLTGGVVHFVASFLICARKLATPKLEVDFEFVRNAIKTALPLSFISVATIIYFRIDTVMLSAMKGPAEVGWYNAAHSLVFAVNPIPVLLTAALFPFMAASFVSSPESLKSTYRTALRYLLILGLPLAAGTMLLSQRIIPLFYGDLFSPAIGALQILAWHILLFFLYSVTGNTLIAMNRQNLMAVAAGSCALLNVVLNLALIPRFSYLGAAIATVATETALLAIYSRMVSSNLQGVSARQLLGKPLVACGAMVIFAYFGRGINLAVLIIGSAVIYFAVLWMIRGLTRADLALLRQAVKGSRRTMR